MSLASDSSPGNTTIEQLCEKCGRSGIGLDRLPIEKSHFRAQHVGLGLGLLEYHCRIVVRLMSGLLKRDKRRGDVFDLLWNRLTSQHELACGIKSQLRILLTDSLHDPVVESPRHARAEGGNRNEASCAFVDEQMKNGIICRRNAPSEVGIDRRGRIAVHQFIRQAQ